MKISKLFHWLYASLMLLPLMVFGVTGLYYGLNQNAQLSERTEQQPIYYQSNEVTSFTDITANNIYKWNDNFEVSPQTNSINVFILETSLAKESFPSYNQYDEYILGIGQSGNAVIFANSDTLANIAFPINNMIFNFIPTSIYSITPTIQNLIYPHVELSNYQYLKEYTDVTISNDISTSIINAWNSTWQNPLFNWSSDSFLIAPFNYITDLFSIPQNNTFSMALSYWLSISIVYLVFDLVMYVPLLAHRWIDKGMVE